LKLTYHYNDVLHYYDVLRVTLIGNL